MKNDAELLWAMLAQQGHYPMGEERRLLQKWFDLQNSYPSDGWVGAADARASHHRKVLACEEELRELHEQSGRHRPERRSGPNGGKPTGKCVCGETLAPEVSDTYREPLRRAKVQRMTLFRLPARPGQATVMSEQSEGFHLVIKEFLARGDCQLVMELENGDEVNLLPDLGNWELLHRQPFQASVLV